MRFNRRRPGYTMVLVGLYLITTFLICASPAPSTPPADAQPPPLWIPLTSTDPLPSLAPEVTLPTLVSVDDLATTTPGEYDRGSQIAQSDPGMVVIEDVSPGITVTADAHPVEDRTPTRLVIPVIRLNAPIEPVGWHIETLDGQKSNVWDVPLHFAAGWLKTSAPLGLPGNTVLDGHHNMYGEVFKNLINLQIGDAITLYSSSQERVYIVAQKLILQYAYQPIEVLRANARYINPTADERLTLVTCWPPTSNTYRLIIIARPVSLIPHEPLHQ
jgi:LPXTG-site transpeptidase (sortase) family protein